jgi:hypothetical protein
MGRTSFLDPPNDESQCGVVKYSHVSQGLFQRTLHSFHFSMINFVNIHYIGGVSESNFKIQSNRLKATKQLVFFA